MENQYGTYEIQKQLLMNMKDVHKFLTDNNIAYSLCAGSLLGAIRHNGFIPWDDDIDIMMDRYNYDLFIDRKENLYGYEVKKELWTYRIRQIGKSENIPPIDVFVLDNCPDNIILRKVKVFLIRTVQGMLKENICYDNYSALYRFCLRITYLLGLPFSQGMKTELYDCISKICNENDTKYLSCYNSLFSVAAKRYCKDIMKSTKLHDFEDTQFYITEYYDEYLTTQYGDYMIPIEENQRKPLHI